MDEVAEGVIAFISWAEDNPLPQDMANRDVLAMLRRRLDVHFPSWRTRALAASPAVEVEFRMADGRLVRGVLVQRPSVAA